MDIFENIKRALDGTIQRLMNIGRKKLSGIEDHKIPQTAKQRRGHLFDKLQFDAGNLLDPRVCIGKDLMPNILKACRAHNDIVKNPRVMGDITSGFINIAARSGINMQFEQPTRETIDKIVNVIKNNCILTSDGQHYEISIDQKTGAVTIQVFPDHEWICACTYTPDGNGNVIENHTEYFYKKADRVRVPDFTVENVYNPDGIAVKSEFKKYVQEEGQSILKAKIVTTRDDQYPFIAKKEFYENDSELPVGTKYIVIDKKDLGLLYGECQGKVKEIKFDSREQVMQYCDDNKKAIAEACNHEPDDVAAGHQSVKTGLQKLAVKAGILSSEQEIK